MTDKATGTGPPARCPHCGRALTIPPGVAANRGPDRLCSACAVVPVTSAAAPSHAVRAHVESLTALKEPA